MQRRSREAFDLLKGFVDKPGAIPKDRGTRLRMVADKVDRIARQFKKPEEADLASQCRAYAESLYRDYAKKDPARKLVLAVFLGTRSNVDEALDILEEALPTSRPEDLSQTCSLIIQGGKADTKQLERINGIILTAMKKYDRPVPFILALAELRTRQGQYAETGDLYREVLNKVPASFVAMNNLAVLQALQGVNLDESLKLINRAIDIAGPLGVLLDSRATVYMAMKNPEKAIEDMTTAVADQDVPVRLFHLALAYDLAGNRGDAKKALDSALQKGLTKETLHPLELPSFEKLQQELK